MAIYEKCVQLNNGNSMVIATMGEDFFQPENDNEKLFTFSADGSTITPSVNNLIGYLPKNKNTINIDLVQDIAGAGNIPLTEEYEDSDTYQNHKSYFNNNINWLYGSLETGGAYLAKDVSNNYAIGTINGIYTKTVNGETVKRYDYTYVVMNGLSDNDFKECCFVVYEAEIFTQNNYPKLDLLVNPKSQLHIGDGFSLQVAKLDKYIDDVITTPFYKNYPLPWEYSFNSAFDEYGFVQPVVGSRRPIQIFTGYTYFSMYSTWDSDSWEYTGGSWSGGNDFDVDEGGNSETGGNDGDYNSNSDGVDTSDAGQITNDVLLSGFVTLFNPTLANLKAFNNFLFTNITDSIAEQLKRLQTNPLDYIINISMCHFDLPSETTGYIKFAGISSGVTAPIISRQFINLDCGNIDVNEYFGNFLDYNPYTKASLYLPYIGIVQLDIDDIMGKHSNIVVKYTVDLLSGSCIAQVKITRSKRSTNDSYINAVLYEYQGNCFVNIPLSATDWHGAYNSIIQGASAIGSAIGGNPISAVAQSAGVVLSQKVTAQHTGNIQPSHGFMGKQYPYLILTRPIQNMPVNYKGFEGFTSNIRVKVANLIGKGYTEIDNDTIWTDNFGHATKEECNMIKEIMNGGVYL